MKKILLIIENLGSGGAERQICGLAVMLTKLGYPCRLLTYCDNQFYEQYLRKNNVDYERQTNLSNKFTRVFRLATYVRRYKPDVVISYLASVNVSMCLASLLCDTKLIVSERNNNISLSFKDKIRFFLYRRSDRIVPNSNSQANFISQNFPNLKPKVLPIINFVDTVRFKPSLTLHDHEPFRIVTVARYTQQKNVLRFLDVVKKAKVAKLNVRFDWYGDKESYSKYYATVIQKYNTLDIADYLSLHDSSDNIEVIYKESDALCLPSLYEGYPNVVVEAMSCGLPVICANRFENPYIVEDKINGYLFDPENVDDIFSAIVWLLNLTEEEKMRMRVMNRKISLVRNSKDAFIQSYVRLIESL